MNLLIIGAGGHGKVVAEVAADCGYKKIDFLDDNSQDAVGKISDLEKFVVEYKNAFVGIGNNKFRGELIAKLETYGYQIPTLVHPTAYVSRTTSIDKGTIIEPKAIVNANTIIGVGCIISVGSIVDHDVVVEKFCHINAGSIVKAGATVNAFEKIEAGEVKIGYHSTIVENGRS